MTPAQINIAANAVAGLADVTGEQAPDIIEALEQAGIITPHDGEMILLSL